MNPAPPQPERDSRWDETRFICLQYHMARSGTTAYFVRLWGVYYPGLHTGAHQWHQPLKQIRAQSRLRRIPGVEMACRLRGGKY